MIKAGSPEDMDRLVARLDADKIRPMDDSSPIRDFPKYGRPGTRSGVSGTRAGPARNATPAQPYVPAQTGGYEAPAPAAIPGAEPQYGPATGTDTGVSTAVARPRYPRKLRRQVRRQQGCRHRLSPRHSETKSGNNAEHHDGRCDDSRVAGIDCRRGTVKPSPATTLSTTTAGATTAGLPASTVAAAQ